VNKEANEYRSIGSEGAEGGGDGIPPRRLKTFDSFKNPAYCLYFGAMTSQWVSMNMQIVVRSLLVYRITGSGAILGSMSLANAIPMLTLSLFGGVIADRVAKKNILFIGEASLSVVSLGVALALTMGYLGVENPGSWWILMVSSMLQGTVMGLMMPATMAIIPEIVGEKQLMNAISLSNLSMNTLRLVSPALTGFLVDAFDFDVVYYIQAVMYLVAVTFITFLPGTRATAVPGRSTLVEIKEGFRYIRRETTVSLIVLFSVCCTVFGQPFTQLLPMFTEDILKVGATGLGVLMSISGAGSLLISLVIASIPERKRGLLALLSGLIMGLALVSFSFSSWWYFSLVVVAFYGVGFTGYITMSTTLIQHYVDADYRGRVMSFQMMAFGFASLGTFFAGLLSEAIGIQWSVGGMAIALLLMCLMVLTLATQLRKLD
jgi:MFS family permease